MDTITDGTSVATTKRTVEELLTATLSSNPSRSGTIKSATRQLIAFLNSQLLSPTVDALVGIESRFCDWLRSRRYAPTTVTIYRHEANFLLNKALHLGWLPHLTKFEESWSPVLKRLEDNGGCKRIVNFAILSGKGPSELTDSDLKSWVEERVRLGRNYNHLLELTRLVRRAIASASIVTSLSMVNDNKARRYGIRLDNIPEPLQSEIRAVLLWKQARHAPGRPKRGKHRPVSAKKLKEFIERFYGFAVNIKHRTNINSLLVLVTKELVDQYLTWALDERDLEPRASRGILRFCLRR